MIKSGMTKMSVGWDRVGCTEERREMVSSRYCLVLGMSKYILKDTPTKGLRFEVVLDDMSASSTLSRGLMRRVWSDVRWGEGDGEERTGKSDMVEKCVCVCGE